MLLNTPADLRKHPKDLASFKISPPDGAGNKAAEYRLLQNPEHLPKDTLQRIVCDFRTRGEARGFGNTLFKLVDNDFLYGG
ncbi:hypothetical protein CEXT_245071 [Caerostris extrusa]|uniref:Uncharacterized protein n=1 Tax=Caerostris extrusa TaxID=172846 RepID=A0AAV4XC57_CAEEX|nr:hypothetical protein CEXT_245071 [Caerostris extrusa]